MEVFEKAPIASVSRDLVGEGCASCRFSLAMDCPRSCVEAGFWTLALGVAIDAGQLVSAMGPDDNWLQLVLDITPAQCGPTRLRHRADNAFMVTMGARIIQMSGAHSNDHTAAACLALVQRLFEAVRVRNVGIRVCRSLSRRNTPAFCVERNVVVVRFSRMGLPIS